ncbi:MAG: hypothetical protein FJZ92_11820 [Chloroflexi bacterium]|nr:hypothetical protein [Chloroflexota bacterium]
MNEAGIVIEALQARAGTPTPTPAPATGAKPAPAPTAAAGVQAAPAPGAASEAATPTPAEELSRLAGLGLPLGWSHRYDAGFRDVQLTGRWVFESAIPKVFGIGLTALALMLGAPFWFDALSKLVKLRASGEEPATSTGGAAGGGE